MREGRLIGNLMLTCAALIWGCAFVAQSVGMDYMGPFTFQTVRSLVGALSLLPVIYLRRRAKPAPLAPRQKKILLWGGALCGLIVAVATGLQQVALIHSSAGKAGFLTALYIILVPLAGQLMGKKARPLLWLCVLIAAVGLYLLSIGEGFTIAPADLLLILCAFVFTGHILLVDHISPHVPGVELCAIQFLICGLISAVPMALFETPAVSQLRQGWIPILYAGVLSSGVAYTLQILGQKRTTPTMASLLMSLEAVFAVLCGMLVLGEMLSLRETIGCALMFAAILLAQRAQMPAPSDPLLTAAKSERSA